MVSGVYCVSPFNSTAPSRIVQTQTLFVKPPIETSEDQFASFSGKMEEENGLVS